MRVGEKRRFSRGPDARTATPRQGSTLRRRISFMCVTEKGERTIVRAFEGDSLSAALQQANLLNL